MESKTMVIFIWDHMLIGGIETYIYKSSRNEMPAEKPPQQIPLTLHLLERAGFSLLAQGLGRSP